MLWQTLNLVSNSVRIGRTTLETRQQAIELAERLIDARLVACAQVDGPITSVYRWKENIEKGEEWGLTLKFSMKKEDELTDYLQTHHPYEEPQWLHWEAAASKGLGNWVKSESDER